MTATAVFAASFAGLASAHYAADYLFQGDRMSKRKSGWTEDDTDPQPGRHHHGWGTNQLHALAHTATELVVLGLMALVLDMPLPVVGVAVAVVWIHVTHSLIDRRWPVRLWMAHTGSKDFIDRGGMPLVDQAMHIAVGLFPAALAIGGWAR
ncbi:DUF3307 domain-containing protein [Streptomyces sp. NPDC045456]|uniref:DUF3307 domain-containing protein n=1 Tax=Streptomyces sp. NPDC045456 TaxID=3155254 RepID=UPI0033EC2C55